MKQILVKLASAAVVLAAFLPVSGASAWTWQGHQVVANVAEMHLNPVALAEVTRLLQTEGKSRMSEISSWADDMRSLASPRQLPHSVRLPLDDSGFEPKRDCKNGRCILAAIDGDLKTLEDQKAPDAARVAALKYLVHFIGDLHQPLHTSIRNGVEEVVVDGKTVPIHEVWDRYLVTCKRMDVDELSTYIDSNFRSETTGGDPVDWAIEGRDIARDQIYPNLRSISNSSPVVLPDDYCQTFAPIVDQRLKQAGARLAAMLNAALHP